MKNLFFVVALSIFSVSAVSAQTEITCNTFDLDACLGSTSTTVPSAARPAVATYSTGGVSVNQPRASSRLTIRQPIEAYDAYRVYERRARQRRPSSRDFPTQTVITFRADTPGQAITVCYHGRCSAPAERVEVVAISHSGSWRGDLEVNTSEGWGIYSFSASRSSRDSVVRVSMNRGQLRFTRR